MDGHTIDFIPIRSADAFVEVEAMQRRENVNAILDVNLANIVRLVEEQDSVTIREVHLHVRPPLPSWPKRHRMLRMVPYPTIHDCV